MLNTIAIMVLIVIATRVCKIYKNGGVTNVATEVYEAGSHMIASSIIFGIFMFILS